MIKEKDRKGASRRKEGNGPGHGNIVTTSFQGARKDDQSALSGDHGDTVESRSHSDKGGLVMLPKPEHVEADHSDVMGCRAKGHQPEEGKGILKETRSWNR